MTLDDAISAASQPDWLNPLFAALQARSKDTAAKTWWHAEAMHPALFRSLRMDRAETGAVFAAVPFRLHRSDDGPRILVAFPCPRILAPHDNDDWLEIETVLAWNPLTDTAEVMGEPGPVVIGQTDPVSEAAHIFASPFAFFRALAENRAQWFVMRAKTGGPWKQRPREPDMTPGFLLIGEADQARWPIAALPRDLVCHGLEAKAVNSAILRQAQLPRASSAPAGLRSAA